MTDLALTVAAICDVVEKFTGNTDAGNALGHVNSGYRRMLYEPVDSRSGRSHIWSFMKPLAQINVGGSANAYAVASGVYVFASAGVFDRSMVGLTMTVVDYDGSNDLSVNITDYSSATCVLVDSSASWTATGGSANCSVESDGLADLPSTYGGLIDPFVYIYSESTSEGTPRLRETSPEAILQMWRNEDDTDDPTRFAVMPKEFTAATGQRFELMVAPRPSEQRTFLYRYMANPAVLTDAAVYGLGGPAHSETLKYAALAAAEQELGRVDGAMEGRYQRLLIGSIDTDTNLFMTHAVESLEQR